MNSKQGNSTENVHAEQHKMYATILKLIRTREKFVFRPSTSRFDHFWSLNYEITQFFVPRPKKTVTFSPSAKKWFGRLCGLIIDQNWLVAVKSDIYFATSSSSYYVVGILSNNRPG
jgi:hypothetical protein